MFVKKISKAKMDRHASLEDKLLQYFISIQLAWAFANTIGSFLIRMPLANTLAYGFYFLGLFGFFWLGYITKKEKLFRHLYFVLIFFAIPFLWYFAGGAKSSANILFVCEIIVYTMCLKGRVQKVFIIVSLLSSGVVQNITRRLPNPVYPMDERQYHMGGSILGITTTLLIATVLFKQKAEYMLERDAAIASEKELEKSNSMQKNFLANMSHEIRSPLGIVMGFNNLIKDSNDIEQIHEYSKDITQAGTTLLTVINDILDYSKIESGKLDIIEDDYSFNSLIVDISRDIGLKCTEKGLKFSTRTDGDIPNNLYGDNIRIRQCLINLLSNAVKYTEKGAVIFVVQNEGITEDGRQCIKFIVKDTGKGISKEAIPNLYSAFQRLDEGMNRGIEGTGLGLAITKNLLDEMGGTIEVSSELGVGTTFTVRLTQGIGTGLKTEAPVDKESDLKGIRVLVVDDTALNLTLIRKLLERDGAIVFTIDNGKECLLETAVTKYDIILLDHMMPDMNGVEVFQKIREQQGVNDATPVVMLTANAMTGAMQEYLEMGFDGYVSKPVSPVELKETILKLTR